jgi:hypothetical protein
MGFHSAYPKPTLKLRLALRLMSTRMLTLVVMLSLMQMQMQARVSRAVVPLPPLPSLLPSQPYTWRRFVPTLS